MSGQQLRLLGVTEVVDGRRAHRVRAPRLRTLLALLAVAGDAGLPVATLTAELWPDPPATAARTVRAYLYKLRRLLDAAGGSDWLVTTPTGYAARIAPERVDVRRCAALAEAGLRALRAGDADDARYRLREATRLWRGEPFADVDAGPVLRAHAQRHRELRAAVQAGLVDAEMLAGRHREVLPELAALVADAPTHEGLSARLIVCLHRAGRRRDALAEYARLARVLDEDLGLAPSARLRRLADRLADPDGYVDWQLLRADHREDAGDCVLGVRAPSRTTALSGRDGDVAALTGLLRAGAVVSLTGPPGVGKTALALETARRAADDFPDGQVVVDLGGRDGPRPPGAVLRRLLAALGAPEPGGGAGEPAAAFRSWTADRRLLLVLDDAAGTAQVTALLPGGTACAALVTSTECLRGLPGAVWRPVEPLGPVASAQALARLLGDGWTGDAAAVDTVVRLCDGLPLALATAARLAQRRRLTAAELATLLADDAARLDLLYAGDAAVHGRMRACWQRFDAPTRALWRRLSWLPPTFPDDAVTAAADAAGPVGPLVGRLLQASLLRRLEPGAGGPRGLRLTDAARLYGRAEPKHPIAPGGRR